MNLLSSDDESAKEYSSEESERPRPRNVRKSRHTSRPNYDEEDDSSDHIRTRHKTHKQAPADEDQIMQVAKSKMDLVSEEDQKIEDIITRPTNLIPRDDNFSVRASKSIEGFKVAKQQRFAAFPKIRDTDYVIDTKIKP